jgi:hypothetical protein
MPLDLMPLSIGCIVHAEAQVSHINEGSEVLRTRLELPSQVDLTPRVRQMAGLFDALTAHAVRRATPNGQGPGCSHLPYSLGCPVSHLPAGLLPPETTDAAMDKAARADA